MRNCLILLTIFSLLISCDQDQTPKPQTDPGSQVESKIAESQKAQDTIFNYWKINLDTISDHREFVITSQNYLLELKTFSLNDSSKVRNLGLENSQVHLDLSHTMVTDIKLATGSEVDQKRIEKAEFQEYLETRFYQESNILETRIDSVIENKIHLTTDLAIPESDDQWRVWYSIKIVNNRLEKVEVEKTDYVGL